MKKKITLKDIAKKCNVSTATVSFVINNNYRKGISPITWNKIENVLNKYSYKKSRLTKKIKRIVFCFESATHLATSRFLEGIGNDVLYENDFIFLFNAISNKLVNLDKVYNKYNPDGIIIATGRTKKLDLDISNYKLSNLILLNCWSNDFKGISILPADYHSTKEIIKNYIKQKKKNIAIILPENSFWQGYEDRLSGWRDAHLESDLNINNKLICKPSKSKKYSSDADAAYQLVDKLIKSKVKFDTIYATNDYLAMGCYQAAKENKLSIPKDFSIIGFDNSLTAKNLKPPLTSIQLPIAQMTRKAIYHVFNEKRYDENFKVFVDCDLVKRDSA